MGSWGTGPFDNDDAADFAGDIGGSDEWNVVAAMIEDALQAVLAADGYVEAPEMSRAIAAAAIVAAMARPGLLTSSSLDESWLNRARMTPSTLLRTQAKHVLARAFEPEDNEWHELWTDAGLLAEVSASTAPYSAALA